MFLFRPIVASSDRARRPTFRASIACSPRPAPPPPPPPPPPAEHPPPRPPPARPHDPPPVPPPRAPPHRAPPPPPPPPSAAQNSPSNPAASIHSRSSSQSPYAKAANELRSPDETGMPPRVMALSRALPTAAFISTPAP